ncbi:MAG: hypothetical protein IH962_03825 [Chloroflexi bacterium]|nr:hypothetical protein [Chloroflexota bacterium]
MRSARNRNVAESSVESDDGDSGLLLAESTRVPDLPGLIFKKVVLGTDETGFLTSRGNVISELRSGPNKVGWSFLGFLGSSSREVVRLHNRPFRLRLHFSNLLSKGYETLDSIVHLTGSVTTPSLFYSTVLRGKDTLHASQLASTIAAGVDDLVQVKVTETDGQALRHDQETQKRMLEELEPHLGRAMGERGLRLESVDLVAFQNPGESDELLDELEEVEELIAGGVKPGREDIQRILNRLRTAGLATPEMAERAILSFDGGTNEAFFNVMKDISRASRRRLEAQVADRSEQLSRKVNAEEHPTRSGPWGMETLLKVIGPICGIAGLAYKVGGDFVGGLVGAPIVLVGGLIAGGVFITGYLLVRAKRLFGFRNRDEIVIRLDRWAKRDSMATDDLIRRQMGREFSNSLADVKDAKLVAFRQEKKEIAESLNDLENRMDLMRTEVESAPAASTIVSAKKFPTRRISRMVSFEEDLLRQARNLSIRAQTAKESLDNEDVEALRTGLDNFQRTFSKRLGLLEGFREL